MFDLKTNLFSKQIDFHSTFIISNNPTRTQNYPELVENQLSSSGIFSQDND